MKKIRYILKLMPLICAFLCTFSSAAQGMNTERLLEIVTSKADTVFGPAGNWHVVYKERMLFCITDSTNNRMRIIAPITTSRSVNDRTLLDAMTANFHTALDVRYAIADDFIWSAFIHPLAELSAGEVESALDQVYLAAETFGTTFSSTGLLFGGGSRESLEEEEKEPILQKL